MTQFPIKCVKQIIILFCYQELEILANGLIQFYCRTLSKNYGFLEEEKTELPF